MIKSIICSKVTFRSLIADCYIYHYLIVSLVNYTVSSIKYCTKDYSQV